MKSIALDFKNNMICFMLEGQQGTEHNINLKKVAFNSFIPEGFRERNSFTWNFESETLSVNQDYEIPEGSIMTQDCFVPDVIVPMPKLGKRYEEFVSIMGYEEVDLKAEMPAFLRDFLGL